MTMIKKIRFHKLLKHSFKNFYFDKFKLFLKISFWLIIKLKQIKKLKVNKNNYNHFYVTKILLCSFLDLIQLWIWPHIFTYYAHFLPTLTLLSTRHHGCICYGFQRPMNISFRWDSLIMETREPFTFLS